MPKPKSRHVLKLEELGFRKVIGENIYNDFPGIVALVELETKRKLSRRERRSLLAFMRHDIKSQPSYCVTNFNDGKSVTEATDDTGQLWETAGSVNLEPFGFLNNAKKMLELLSAKPTLQ